MYAREVRGLASLLLLLLPIVASAAATPPPPATPAPKSVELLRTKGGEIVLSLSGLDLDVAPTPGIEYAVTGSWSLSNGFDARDVVDEWRGDKLVAGNWVLVGYFNAGDCPKVLAEADLADAWTAHTELWGEDFDLRGGIYDSGDAALGKYPAIAACTQLGSDKQLLLYRFFVSDPAGLAQATMIERFRAAAVSQAAWQAYEGERVATVLPTHRKEIRRRGDASAVRTETLDHSGLTIAFPDDGQVWIVQHDPNATTDFMNRMAPALPEVNMELVLAQQPSCTAAFDSIGLVKRAVAPRNLPPGWIAGPQLEVGAELELTACRPVPGGELIVGFFMGPRRTDVAQLTGMLDAISSAAGAQ